MCSRGSVGGPRAGWPVRRALVSSGDDGAATGARGLVFLSAGLRRKARSAPARTFLRTRVCSWPDRSPQVGQRGRAGGRCTQKCEQGGSGISDPWPIGHEVANGRAIWPHHLRSHKCHRTTVSVHLVGYGRANHAGSGDDDRQRVQHRRQPALLRLRLHQHQNWPEAQLDAMHKVSAALCRAHGWSEKSVIAHKEWQPGKPDPASITMSDFRTAMARLLGASTEPSSGSSKPSGSTSDKETSGYAPFPGAGYFRTGRRSALITAMGKRLVAEGCGKYGTGPGPRWTDADRRS
ncbi:peptidoglycan-binding protein [Streptomyces sp. NBC_01176]|uniref:peptidoglycan-binding protein n=1 Tax=Streptomyces sp. NBC_01176 TaxID=2903760 RepID=UPI00386DE52F|nr:peptidoglycan-binding protein [Streptomyces sp. NBC_01176]